MAPNHALSLIASSKALGLEQTFRWKVPSSPLGAVSHWLVTLEPDREERAHIHPADRYVLRDKAGSVGAEQGPGSSSHQRWRLPAAPVLCLGWDWLSPLSWLKPGEGPEEDLGQQPGPATPEPPSPRPPPPAT